MSDDSAFETRTVGRGATVTRLGFGGAPIGNLYTPVSDADADAALQASWDGGIRYFDTAPHYGLGLSERRLGRFLANHRRDDFVVSTKVGRLLVPNPNPVGSDLANAFAVDDDLTRAFDFSADGVRRSLEASLERLGLDRVNIVLVHDPDDHLDTAINQAIPALAAMRDEGMIDAIGVGMNFVEPLLKFVRETDIDVVMAAGRWTLLDRSAAPLLAEAAQRDIKILSAAPFNSGLLATDDLPGTFDYGAPPDDVLERARRARDLCRARGVSVPAAAIQFPMRSDVVASVVVGMRSAAEATADLTAASTPIPDDLWAELEEL